MQPGLVTAMLRLLWYGVKASEARMLKRFDELREDQKASEARQREDTRALTEKIDRLGEALLTSRPQT